MANIEVKGKINRIFYENKGLEIVETYTNKAGKEINSYYTVWLKTPSVLNVGDNVKVKGLYSHEISEWDSEGETKRKVKVSINNPLVVPIEANIETEEMILKEETPF